MWQPPPSTRVPLNTMGLPELRAQCRCPGGMPKRPALEVHEGDWGKGPFLCLSNPTLRHYVLGHPISRREGSRGPTGAGLGSCSVRGGKSHFREKCAPGSPASSGSSIWLSRRYLSTWRSRPRLAAPNHPASRSLTSPGLCGSPPSVIPLPLGFHP